MKKVLRLTESDIHRIVKNSVQRILKEGRSVDVEMSNGNVYTCYTPSDIMDLYNQGKITWRDADYYAQMLGKGPFPYTNPMGR